MSIVKALRYTGSILGTAASKVAVEVGEVQRLLTDERARLKAARDSHGKLLADVQIAKSRIGKAGNDKSRAWFEQQAAQAEAFVPKSEENVRRIEARVATLSKKDDALQVKWAKLAHDSDGMNDEAARLAESGVA